MVDEAEEGELDEPGDGTGEAEDNEGALKLLVVRYEKGVV